MNLLLARRVRRKVCLILFLLSVLLSLNGCVHKEQHINASANLDNDIEYQINLSEEKYSEIHKTLYHYLSHSGMSEDEQEEFIYSYCDTIHPCLNSVFFRYRSKINGFNVEGVLGVVPNGSMDYQSCYGSLDATLYFSSDSLTFSILHPTFKPFADETIPTLKPLECIELEYKIPIIPNPKRICLDSIRELPFAFVDIDFDGNKELLLANPGNGQKSISTYTAYSIPNLTKINPFKEYTWNCLDEWTEFDYSTKTVISSLWGGYDGSEKWYFKYEGNRLKPYLKEEYTHWFDSIKSSTPIQ